MKDMAQIKLIVRNRTTGKVCYSAVKATGSFDNLYTKLLDVANRIFQENRHIAGYYIYGHPYYHWYTGADHFSRLLCAYNTYYFSYGDSAYDYVYSIIKR